MARMGFHCLVAGCGELGLMGEAAAPAHQRGPSELSQERCPKHAPLGKKTPRKTQETVLGSAG